jgi:hypothetical protein
VRVWCELDVEAAIITIIPHTRHEIGSRMFYYYIATSVAQIPGYDGRSIKGVHQPSTTVKQGGRRRNKVCSETGRRGCGQMS